MNRPFYILFVIFVVSFGTGIETPLCNDSVNVTINGTITNMEAMRKYMDNDTFLQIVKLPPSGCATNQDDRGRHYLKSNLKKVSFPQNGTFKIQTNLLPGRYIICGQYFNSDKVHPFLAKSKKMMASFLIKNKNSNQEIHLGNAYFQNWYGERFLR